MTERQLLIIDIALKVILFAAICIPLIPRAFPPKPKDPEPPPLSAAVPELSFAEMIREYEEDSRAANIRYRDKWAVLTGEFLSSSRAGGVTFATFYAGMKTKAAK